MSLDIIPNVHFTLIPRQAILVDVDGFLSDQSPRLHYIEKHNRTDEDWIDFFSEQHLDKPIQHNVEILLGYFNDGFTIILLTSRPQEYDQELKKWLSEHNIPAHMIISRPNKRTEEGKRFETSAQFKKEVAIELQNQGWDISAFYDDHKDNTKEVYEATGIPSFYIVTMGSPGYSE